MFIGHLESSHSRRTASFTFVCGLKMSLGIVFLHSRLMGFGNGTLVFSCPWVGVNRRGSPRGSGLDCNYQLSMETDLTL